MNQLGLTIDADVTLHAEVPFVALLRLVHLRVTLFILVLGRGRCINDGRIHNRTGTDFQTVLLKILVDQLEQTIAQVVGLQQMSKLANRRFIRCRLATQVSMPTKLRIARESYNASSTAGSERLNQCCRK